MRHWFSVAILLLVYLSSNAQDDDYYRLPTHRRLNDGQITLPNLKTESVFWYFRPYGGIKIQGNKFNRNEEERLVSSSSGDICWALNMGINRADRWELEIGYMKDPQNLQWRLKAINGEFIPYSFAVRKADNRIQIQYKKRLFIVDRVTKKTRVNLVLGVQTSPWRKAGILNEIDFIYPTIPSSYGYNDTLKIQAQFKQLKNLPTGLAGLELTGRLAEQVEIGLYSLFSFEPTGILNSSIQINSTLADPILSEYQLRGFSALVGITLRWNFLNVIRYTPENL